jgi:hypothetical protein
LIQLSRVIGAILVAAILTTSSFVYSAKAQLIYDDFNDNQIDSSRWTRGVQGSNPPVIEETNQRVEISFSKDSAGSSFSAGYGGLCVLNGDFDIQVDYDLLVWPSTSGVRVGLGVSTGSSFWVVERVSLGTSNDFFFQSDREVYATDYNGNVKFTSTGDNSGTLRLVRSGNSLTAYAGSNTLASSTITSADLQFSFASWSADYAFTDKEVKIAFDNFVVNEGAFANCDLTPPKTNIDSATDGDNNAVPDGGTTPSSSITFTFSSPDSDVAKFQCSIDGAEEWQDCTSPQTYPNLNDGSHIFAVIAIDNTGNADQTPAEHKWTVQTTTEPKYTIRGFYAPVNMEDSNSNPVINTIRSGQSVALKFEVFDQDNVEQTSTDVIQSSKQNRVNCGTLEGNPADAIETTNTGGTSLRYDAGGGTFIQNWKTPSGQAGNCYSATVTTVDGSSITAYLQLR